MGQERWIGSKEDLLLLQRTWAQFPTSMSGVTQSLVTSGSGICHPLPSSMDTCTHRHRYTNRHTYIHLALVNKRNYYTFIVEVLFRKSYYWDVIETVSLSYIEDSSLAAGFLVLWCLQSFHSLFHNIPWALCGGVVL